MFPSVMERHCGTEAAKQPHNIMLPPPCLTVGIRLYVDSENNTSTSSRVILRKFLFLPMVVLWPSVVAELAN